MNDEKFNVSVDIYPVIMMTITFIILKIWGVIQWDWVWVFTPLYVFVGLILSLILIVLMIKIIKNAKGGGSTW